MAYQQSRRKSCVAPPLLCKKTALVASGHRCQTGHWPNALNSAAIRRLPAVQSLTTVPDRSPLSRSPRTRRPNTESIGLIGLYSTGVSTEPRPEVGTNSIYRAFRPTMTASMGLLSRRFADKWFHSDLSRLEGWGWSSGWVCHSPK